MPVLKNARHEAFAQGLAKGLTADEAYQKAGFKPNRGNAATLKQNQSISKRVTELLEWEQTVERRATERAIFTDAEDWSSGKDQLVQNAKRVWAKAKHAGATVSYDTIGVGAFVGGYIDEQNEENGASVEHFAFHAGGAVMDPDEPSDTLNSNSPLNKHEYLNLKAQAWANTARRAMLTFNAVTRGQAIRTEDVLSFSSSIGKEKLDALFTELCVPWWVETEGKKRVVPKVKLKKDLGVKSHNLADALIAADNVNIASSGVAMFLTKRHR